MGDLFTTRSGIVLRPYQEECIEKVHDAFKDHQSALIVMATGLGKTLTAAEIMRQRGGRCMWVAHRGELIEQAENAIGNLTGVVPQVEMADRYAQTQLGGSGCVVASVQTLNAKRQGKPRMARFDANLYNTLVSDECHHVLAATWQRMSDHFCANPSLRHLGMTATPDRGDGLALGQIYSHCAYRYDIHDGVNDGWLVPILVQRMFLDSIDLNVITKLAGDFNKGELAHQMEQDKPMQAVASGVLDEASNRKTLVFTSSVKHAEGLCEILNIAKPNSAFIVHGKTPKDKRRAMLNEYRGGGYQYMCNVGIATEGFDIPDIECVAVARPTMSRSLFAQMIGRGTRPLANTVEGFKHAEQRLQAIHDSKKGSCLILDFTGNSGKHKLVSAADVLGGNYTSDVIDKANKLAIDSEPVDTLELLKKAEAIVRLAAEKAAARKMRRATKAKVKFSKKFIDPFDVLDIDPVESELAWDEKSLTYKQLMWLQGSGINTEDYNDAELKKVYGTMINRKLRNLATPKQVKLLKRYNYDTSKMTKDEAKQLIYRLVKNNWRKVAQ